MHVLGAVVAAWLLLAALHGCPLFRGAHAGATQYCDAGDCWWSARIVEIDRPGRRIGYAFTPNEYSPPAAGAQTRWAARATDEDLDQARVGGVVYIKDGVVYFGLDWSQ